VRARLEIRGSELATTADRAPASETPGPLARGRIPGPGDRFPDLELADHGGQLRRLSSLCGPSELDRRLGFDTGYPLVVMFYRGFFCPRDYQQMRSLVGWQDELAVSYVGLVSISVDAPIVASAYRAGLGARWTFLSDESRTAIRHLGILDATEGEYPDVSRPFTFVLCPDLAVHRVYDGWFLVGRPSVEELRRDVREVFERLPMYPYAAYDTERVKRLRIPAAAWVDGSPAAGPETGVVSTFDLRSGNGSIRHVDPEGVAAEVFFNFTAIPGQGYRTLAVGTRVTFELVANPTGPSARNVQPAS
jgi:cold shock CspA family protein/peroxiredoxin